jgi:hypothetical protein
LTRVERTWRFSCRARDRVIGPFIVCIEVMSSSAGVRTIQRPVYYVSEVLHEAKTRYLESHKVLYVVLVASRKLCHYFQAHRIVVVTSFP